VAPGELDLEEFTRLADQGRHALAAGDAEHASQLLGAALKLWGGQPFQDVQAPRLADQRARLEQRRLAVLEDRLDADLVEELGIEPGRALQELQRQILGADPILDPPASPAPSAQAPTVPS
jgi:DNA-binding SARP family transcriptional activator